MGCFVRSEERSEIRSELVKLSGAFVHLEGRAKRNALKTSNPRPVTLDTAITTMCDDDDDVDDCDDDDDDDMWATASFTPESPERRNICLLQLARKADTLARIRFSCSSLHMSILVIVIKTGTFSAEAMTKC